MMAQRVAQSQKSKLRVSAIIDQNYSKISFFNKNGVKSFKVFGEKMKVSDR